MKKFIGLLFASFVLVLCTACQSEKKSADYYLDEIKKSKTLLVATNAEFPPFEFQILKNGNNEIVGSDVDLAQVIANELGAKLVMQHMAFDSVLVSLASNKVDMAIAGLSPTPERMDSFDFSIPYYASKNVLIIKKDKLNKYKTAADLKGLQVGGQKGSIQADAISEQLPEATKVELPSVPNMIQEVKMGSLQGMVLEEAIAKNYLEENPDLTTSKFEFKSSNGDAYAIALPKNSGELKKKVDEIIQRLKSLDKINEMVAKNYKLANENK